MPLRRSIVALVLFLGVTFAVAAFGGAATAKSVGTWYQTLNKPPYNPPSWVFGPAWTILYALMAVAAWMVWAKAGSLLAGRAALFAWGVQLALNLGWSWLFFGMRRPGLAFAEILVLWFSILVTHVLFYRVRPAAGFLLTPYLAWVTFASTLNFYIWRNN